MTVTNDSIHALRIGDLVIDADSGEILSEENYALDQLALFLKDGQEQVKAWEAYVGAIKSAIGRKLDEAGVRQVVTPYGTATWRMQVRKSAPTAALDELAHHLELPAAEHLAILECAESLNVKRLESLRCAVSVRVDEIVDALIQEKAIHYVQLMPLRKAAPVVERVELNPDEGN